MGLARQIDHHEAWRVIDELKHRHGSYRSIPPHAAGPYLDHLTLAMEGEAKEAKKESKQAPEFELKALSLDERSGNELRPTTFAQLVGQDRLKSLMGRIVANARDTGQTLDHMLVIGASGTGKTTFAQVVANELGRRVFQVEAPVRVDVLTWLAEHGQDGDILIVDEIHQVATAAAKQSKEFADPEQFYLAMEDRRLAVGDSMLTFPNITFIGATTDPGLLPTAFQNRFPLRLTLDRYTWADMARLAEANAHALNLAISDVASEQLGRASRRTPRLVNSYVKNARSLIGEFDGLGHGLLNAACATEVVEALNATTWDGLDSSQQRMLIALLRSKRQARTGEFVYQASVGAISTALGLGRDTKYVTIEVEPYLIEEGLIVITHGGRQLTEAGIARAEALA